MTKEQNLLQSLEQMCDVCHMEAEDIWCINGSWVKRCNCCPVQEDIDDLKRKIKYQE